jgi:hypothetical protein
MPFEGFLHSKNMSAQDFYNEKFYFKDRIFLKFALRIKVAFNHRKPRTIAHHREVHYP